MTNTIAYYNKNAQTFIDGTVSVDFTSVQNTFLELLPNNAQILDLGSGSGRDTKDFLNVDIMWMQAMVPRNCVALPDTIRKMSLATKEKWNYLCFF